MIDLFDLYKSFKSYVNTYQGGFYRPQTDFTSACNDISMKLWVKWTNLAEKSQEVKDNLLPFLRSKNCIVKQDSAYGTFEPPKDYGRFAAARIILSDSKTYPSNSVDNGKCCNGDLKTDEELKEEYYDTVEEHEVTMIDTQRWAAVNAHRTKKPTFEKPKIRQVDKKFMVAPRQVSVIVLDYYVYPIPASFLYTVVPGNVQTGSGDLIQYDPNSKPLEWPASLRDEFLIQLGERYGLFTRDNFVTQVAAQQKAGI